LRKKSHLYKEHTHIHLKLFLKREKKKVHRKKQNIIIVINQQGNGTSLTLEREIKK